MRHVPLRACSALARRGRPRRLREEGAAPAAARRRSPPPRPRPPCRSRSRRSTSASRSATTRRSRTRPPPSARRTRSTPRSPPKAPPRRPPSRPSWTFGAKGTLVNEETRDIAPDRPRGHRVPHRQALGLAGGQVHARSLRRRVPRSPRRSSTSRSRKPPQLAVLGRSRYPPRLRPNGRKCSLEKTIRVEVGDHKTFGNERPPAVALGKKKRDTFRRLAQW